MPGAAIPAVDASTNLVREDWRIPLRAGGEAAEVAVRVVLPSDAPRAWLFCVPGGFLSRHYFDLGASSGDAHAAGYGSAKAIPHAGYGSAKAMPDAGYSFAEAMPDAGYGSAEAMPHAGYSFAEAMAHAGYGTLAIDPLGVGESTRPADPWCLGVEFLAEANQRALEALRERVGDTAPTIGVGHSMGSCLTVAQQARFAPHTALLLFSFSTGGLPKFLQGREPAFADRPEAAAEALPALAKERFGEPLPALAVEPEGRGAAFGVGTAPAIAEDLLGAASTNLLAQPGLLAMIPGGYRPWAEAVEVPALIVVGDHDLHSETGLAAALPGSRRVETFTLDDCWHCHFVANTRTRLWRELERRLDRFLEA